jgi:hypothetical protein
MDLRRIFKVLVSFLILLGEFCWECFDDIDWFHNGFSLFSIYRNTEKGQVHRDVTVLINDGEKTWDMMTVGIF